MELETIIERYIKSYNARDIDGMLECVTNDVIFENISNTGQSMRLEGKDAMGQVAELSCNALFLPSTAAHQPRPLGRARCGRG